MSASTVVLRDISPAKINLFLHITGRRANGYHNLESLFCPVDLCDQVQLTITQASHLGLELHREGPLAALPETLDLTAQAVRRYFEGQSNPHWHIRIAVQKNIPAQAGLGGGSSNAATVLRLLNSHFKCYSPHALLQLALKLGADVPFFMQDDPAFVEGIGEHLTPIRGLSASLLIYKPPENCPTPQIFASEELTRNSKPVRIAVFGSGNLPLTDRQLVENSASVHTEVTCNQQASLLRFIQQCTVNAMQSVVEAKLPSWHQQFAEFTQACVPFQPSLVRMSGSGSAMFAWFNPTQNVGQAAQAVQQRPVLQQGQLFECKAASLNRVGSLTSPSF